MFDDSKTGGAAADRETSRGALRQLPIADEAGLTPARSCKKRYVNGSAEAKTHVKVGCVRTGRAST